jgi:2-polyprenyl-3-methyl-5-hydroxy-6-metoxy-1,4-benzoquinol methylase
MQQRSTQKELLDLGADNYSQAEYIHCMKMLFRVNKVFGFFKSTVNILKKFSKETSLMDVGCGDGLFILNLSKKFSTMTLKGIDISVDAISLAQKNLIKFTPVTNVSFDLIQKPELDISQNSVDVILATMMCHHLNNDELLTFIQQAFKGCRRAVIINDLHRHFLAYFFYRFLSPLLFRNRLITHDGLISIQRGFVRSELIAILEQANIKNYQIKWRFPFRWQLILWKN